MKAKKKLQHVLAMIMAIVMLIGTMPIAVFADMPNETAEPQMKLEVSSLTGMPGETVAVTIEAADNPGIASLKFDVKYNSVLTLKGIEFNSAFGAMVTAPQPYTNPQPITMISPLEDVDANGVFATLTFEISENAPDGFVADISITHDPADIFNGADEQIALDVVNGKVSIYHGIPGDINKDKAVNTKDAIALFRHVAGWGVDVDADALDVNGDGNVNTKDAIALFRFVAGWDVEIVRPTKHNHDLKLYEAKEPTCTESGNTAYYFCSGCNKYYSDENAQTEITLSDTVLGTSEHALTKQPGKAPSCEGTGHIDYWTCTACGGYFADEDGNNKIELDSTVRPALGHDLKKVTEKAASCTEEGNITYWYCTVCAKTYADENAKTEIKAEDTVVSATGHALAAVVEKAATCTEDGNIAYWYCSACDSCFADSKGEHEIDAADTVIAAPGHGSALQHKDAVAATVDAAGNTEYWHCTECGKYYADADAKTEIALADTIIPIIPSYTITFIDSKNNPSGTKVRFPQNEDLLLTTYVPAEVAGYVFGGWYSSSTFEQTYKKDYIMSGNTENLFLYAKWTAISYTITYKDAPQNTNVTEYTVEQEVFLADPEWSGLAFDKWTDDNGNEIAKIEKGTTGNITLTANWISERNMAVPSKNTAPKVVMFDKDLDRYYFIFDMGTIENIELATLGTDSKSAGEELKWIISETVSVENNIADTVAKTVSSSYTQTSEWDETYEFIVSESINSKITAGLETEELGIKAKIEAELGVNTGTEESRGYGKGGSTEEGGETSDSVSSTVSYTKGLSTTISKEITISGEMPKGKYSYVYAGTVHVYAIVAYDPVEQNYYIDTYSVLDDKMYEKRMYDAPADTTANITSSKGLTYDLDEQYIKDYVNSVYYVKYDANGGEGSLQTTVHKVNESQKLVANIFTRDGYTFAGWSTNPNGGVQYKNEEEVKDIAAGDEIVTLYAVWEHVPYKVTWNTGSHYTIKVERTSTTKPGAPLGALSNGANVYYGDKLKVTYTVGTTGYHFTTQGPSTITVTGNVNSIYATVALNTYTVQYDANGGSGKTAPTMHTYSQNGALATNAFTRSGWTFLGWSTNKNDTSPMYTNGQSVKNLTTVSAGTVTMYAIWLKTSHSVEYSGRSMSLGKGNTHIDCISTGMSKKLLQDNGYTQIKVTVVFDTKKEDAISLGTCQLAVETNTASTGTEFALTILDTSWMDNITETYYIKVSDLNSDGTFNVRWSHLDKGWGNGEHWIVGTTTVSAVAQK